jgi:DNA polymerase-3 subunit gamma/tau
MSYLVLARKYRPQRFEDVVAQEHVTRTLRNAVKNDRVGSGYLFCGPRGTGKTTVARILAKCLNCAEGPTETPCDKCPSCKEITSGASLDVLEIDAASNTGVDDIRTLRENVRYLPATGRKRIYIVDEVHRLSGSAFDALLKTLEEPPAHVVFMFATTEPLKVPETILSRTQRFDFKRIGADDLVAHLSKISVAEEMAVDDAALTILARKADGSVRDALSLMDQLAAFAGEKITEADVVTALGLVDRGFLYEYTAAVAASDGRRVLELTDRIFHEGVAVADFVSELLEHLRVLMILSSGPAAGELLNLSETEIEEYSGQAELFSLGDLLRMVEIVTRIHADLKAGLDERLLLEVSGMKMAELESTVRLAEVLETIGAAGTNRKTPLPPSGPTVPQGSRQKKNSRAEGGRKLSATRPPETAGEPAAGRTVGLPELQTGWETFLKRLKNANGMLSSNLGLAELRGVTGNKVEVAFAAEDSLAFEMVSKPVKAAVIAESLKDHFGADLSIRARVDSEMSERQTRPEPKTGPSMDVAGMVADSPRLKNLLEKVDGEIIGVRKTETD